jgi:imidazole glycerol-phosphate synthase subunit HisH
MQILYESSEESALPGLGILRGAIKRFKKTQLSVPQMQWNTLEAVGNSPLMRGLEGKPFAYFVHSYYAPVDGSSGAITEYGTRFQSVVSHDNVHATQFHPEKSQAVGLKMLKNFCDWASTR